MPSAKRERKREGRDARREAERAAAKRARQRGIAIRVTVALAVILGVVFLITQVQGEDSAAAKKATTTTTELAASTTTAKPGAAPGFGTTPCPPAGGADKRTASFAAPFAKCIDTAKTYKAEIVTDVGSYTVTLDDEAAPLTVNNFVALARHRFYEGVIFHRVIKGFMNQGGDPDGTGSGGPGYTFADELPAAGEYKIGSLAMANSGPNTNGSQFFTITGPQGTGLPPNYSLFGQVTAGMETVKKIEADGTEGEGKPAVTHKILSVKITES